MELQFLDEAPDVAVPFDDGRTARVPRWLAALLLVALAGIAVVVLVGRQPQAHPHPVAQVPTPADAVDQTLLQVYSRGRNPAAAHDIVRSGSTAGFCRTVRIGAAPQRTATTTLQRYLSGFRMIDTARIIDQSAGLCALQVRARDERGNVAIVNVISPAPVQLIGRRQDLQAHAGVLHDLEVEYAEFTTRDGWDVVVGTSGPRGRQPSVAALGRAATDPAMRW